MAGKLTSISCKFTLPATMTEIVCGAGILDKSLAKLLNRYSSVRVVVDRKVWRLHSDYLSRALPRSADFLQAPNGERCKTQRQLERIWKWLHDTETDRSSVLIGIGGGATTDLAGFAAATYMRGIDLALVPTTLLAQVDAAIGGKTAINLQDTKNIVGAFSPARLVVCDSIFHATLPPRMLSEGIIEAVKMFAALDVKTYRHYRDKLAVGKANELPAGLIADAIRLKCGVVERDPTESGLRRVLNLGHTTGHAYELLNHSTHGEGVAYGMIVAAELSVALLKLPSKTAEELIESVRRIYPKFRVREASATEMWKKIMHDKKRSGRQINFVLLSRLGEHKVLSVTKAQFTRAIKSTEERLRS